MREILFRGKRIDNGEWVEGNLFVPDKVDFRKPPTEILMGTNIVRISYEVDSETVGQYTGLKDKNGKRIFEGDIIGTRYDSLYPDHVTVEVVKWFRNGWAIQEGDYMPDSLTEDGILPYSEIIGNIHDNPELLKGGNEE